MKLEDAIKQHEFTSEAHKLNINFIHTYSWIICSQKQYFEKYDLTFRQFNVLRILRGNYPAPYTTHMIRERMLDQMSDVSRIVERLVKKGYVTSKTCLADKRLVDVVINETGLDLLKKMDITIGKLDKIYGSLNTKEQKTLNHLLNKLRD